MNHPQGVALDEKAGFLYIADTDNHRIHKLTLDGRLVRTAGKPGTEPGEFNLPMGLAVGPQGWLYVADSANRRVQVLDREMRPVMVIRPLEAGAASFTGPPLHMAVTDSQDVIVCDGTDRLRVFSADGAYLGSLSGWREGTSTPKYAALGLREPCDLVAVDQNAAQWHHFRYREIQ